MAIEARREFNINDPVQIYWDEIKNIPLLTAQEELVLGEEIFRNNCLLNNDPRYQLTDVLPPARQLEVLSRRESALQEKKVARQKLYISNLRLVPPIARRYTNKGVPLLDLIQEGNFGLDDAVEKFDYRKGFRFSTYATGWVHHHIQRSIENTSRLIRKPVHAVKAYSMVLELSKNMINEGAVDYEAIAEYMTDYEKECLKEAQSRGKRLKENPKVWTKEKVLDLKSRFRSPRSLEDRILDRSGSPIDSLLRDVIADEYASTSEEAIKYAFSAHIRQILEDILEGRDRTIMFLRYGIQGSRPDDPKITLSEMTQKEIGEILGVTHQAVGNVERRVLERLKGENSLQMLSRDTDY